MLLISRMALHIFERCEGPQSALYKGDPDGRAETGDRGWRLPYATFRQNGWPIGSGPIEAACKTLVKTRLCRSLLLMCSRISKPAGFRKMPQF